MDAVPDPGVQVEGDRLADPEAVEVAAVLDVLGDLLAGAAEEDVD